MELNRLTGTNRISEEYNLLNDNADTIEQAFEESDASVVGVQQNLDDHEADDTRHWTTADRDKMNGIAPGAQVNSVTSVAGRTGAVAVGWTDVESRPSSSVAAIDAAVTKVGGIEAGAEVNQNAFAQVNNITASSESDALTITGGTGISVSTNPTTKTVNITATGSSTPGPHAASHLEDGSDPIPLATPTNGGLMSAEDKDKLNSIPSGPPWTWADLEG
ncbi:hypothetical protein B1748_29170 [Paenibacillus sp. MY03]|uniref:hypothetical protein n=1 Tax=Paenibacillus sp. MY03 TaxID=302980 RepID=UPI000B3BF9BC|nr:hypothetical protein [Paenibacillus sp. MY03]OUS70308.1 hypothetical protein B1748_29170 [Paenibacillus sp. MY03]